MSTRTLQDQIDSLLGRRIAEAKTRGAPSPDAEALAIYESITTSLLLRPKAVLYIAHLARNGLLKVISDELENIAETKSAVSDLGNVSFIIRTTKTLEKARSALLNLEGLDKISTDSSAFQRFDSAVSEFLETYLSKSVRQSGSTSLIRPGDEAAVDLGTLFVELKDLHADMLDRLYALAVGISNFLSSPLSTLLGLSTATRVRSDIDSIIDTLQNDPTAQNARDMATRLIGSRAAIKVIGTLPDLNAPVLSTSDKLPLGYEVSGISDLAVASKISGAGPFVLPASAAMTVSINGSSAGPYGMPQTNLDLQNRAFVVSDVAPYPASIPAHTHLFIQIERSDGVVEYYRVILNDTASPVSLSLSQVITLIHNTLNGAGVGGALEYINVLTGRILIWAEPTGSGFTRDRISVAPILIDPTLGLDGFPTTYSLSAHSQLGLFLNQSGTRGSTPAFSIVDFINRMFGSLVTASLNNDGTFIISSVADAAGTQMVLTCPSVLGISGTASAASSSMSLYGTVFGVETDPIPAASLVDIGDKISTPSGVAYVSSFDGSKIILSSALSTFDGDITVTSALIVIRLMDDAIELFLRPWLKTKYSEDLSFLDSAVAALGSNATIAQRNSVIRILDEIQDDLLDLQSLLQDAEYKLPNNTASREKSVVNGIISTLEERKYDRALSLMLRCKIQEFLSLSYETSSFGGTVMRAMSDVAQQDIKFPNTAVEDEEPKGRVDRTGIV